MSRWELGRHLTRSRCRRASRLQKSLTRKVINAFKFRLFANACLLIKTSWVGLVLFEANRKCCPPKIIPAYKQHRYFHLQVATCINICGPPTVRTTWSKRFRQIAHSLQNLENFILLHRLNPLGTQLFGRNCANSLSASARFSSLTTLVVFLLLRCVPIGLVENV